MMMSLLKSSIKEKEIPKEKLNRIFENFYRLDSARTSRTGGSGFGLAIAKEIVELHHGSIFASSNQRKKQSSQLLSQKIKKFIEFYKNVLKKHLHLYW